MTTESNKTAENDLAGTDSGGGSDHQAPVWKPALKEAAWAFLSASLLLVLAYTLFFSQIHPEFVPFMDRAAQKVAASGNDLIPVSRCLTQGREEHRYRGFQW